MNLRCKPHQLALIDIPADDAVEEIREQFNGIPVTTCRLVGDGSDFWVISPKLVSVMRRPCVDDLGVEAPAGAVNFGSVCDKWLRPI